VPARSPGDGEATRLERLWAGEFGDAYVDRNSAGFELRRAFWSDHLAAFPAGRALEIGCNIGGNLTLIADLIGPANCYGIDVNEKALGILRAACPGVNVVSGVGRDVPFRDNWFDLTFTMGVLIHQPEETLPQVMGEMVRCSRRWVMCGEYYAPETTEVAYRGQEGALIKRDFGALFLELFPALTLVTTEFYGHDQGWDDTTMWLFTKEGDSRGE
jgi:pseudaminic acid biosynthesis-associated methylase